MSTTSTHETPQSESGKTQEQARENALALKIILVVVALLAAWGLSVFFWGVPGLYIPALATVPMIYLLLVVIAKG